MIAENKMFSFSVILHLSHFIKLPVTGPVRNNINFIGKKVSLDIFQVSDNGNGH
jgi:hypothetical protein